jgi:hypothetical protein
MEFNSTGKWMRASWILKKSVTVDGVIRKYALVEEKK